MPRVRLRRAARGLGAAALCALLAFAAYASYAYAAYARVPPTRLPCRGCSEGARAVRVNGYDLYYRALGSDRGHPPIVVLHGGPGQSSLTFKGSLDALADDRRVVFYDQRGSGNSEIKPNPADYTIEHLVDDLEVLRRDVIRSDQMVVLGHSFGGALAQRYALAHPDRVSALILVGSIRANNGMSRRWFWKLLGPTLFSTVLGLPPADAAAADAWMQPTPSDSESTGRLYDRTRTDIFTNVGYASFAVWRELSLSIVGPDHRDDLRRLSTPTLVIYGKADSPYTGRDTATALCALMPSCTAVGFAKSGHWPFLEEQDRFLRVVREFLAGR
jgi:proline iminopeptidase